MPILYRSQLNLRTTIIKVKSHIGVQGNEVADQLAYAARQPDECQLSVSWGSHAFNNQMWPQILKCSSNLPGTQQGIYTPSCEPMLLRSLQRVSLRPGSTTHSEMG